MKKIIFYVLFFCMSTFSTKASNPTPALIAKNPMIAITNLDEYLKIRIKIHISLIPPAIDVDVEIDLNVAQPTNGEKNRQISAQGDITKEGKLQVTFDKATITPELKAHFFQGDLFKIAKQGSVSKEALRLMGAKTNIYVIKPGVYKAVDNGKSISVIF